MKIDIPSDSERVALNTFADTLMKNVRDRAIVQVDKTLRGEMNGSLPVNVASLLPGLDMQQAKTLSYLVPFTVDLVLSLALYAVQESPDIRIVVRQDSEVEVDVAAVSDGLAGELWGENGWIKKFSSERSSEQV